MQPPTYFNRWRRYPRSCAGHTLQGFIIGALMLAPAFLPFLPVKLPSYLEENRLLLLVLPAFAALQAIGYFAYQFGSGARKAINRHETDSIGWDCADLSVGGWLAPPAWFGIAILLRII